MKKYLIILSCIFIAQFSFGQNAAYSALIKTADSLYNVKDFKNSALSYSAAFKANEWKGLSDNRYNAASSWALANNSDSAFFQLYRIATKANYINGSQIGQDPQHKNIMF